MTRPALLFLLAACGPAAEGGEEALSLCPASVPARAPTNPSDGTVSAETFVEERDLPTEGSLWETVFYAEVRISRVEVSDVPYKALWRTRWAQFGTWFDGPFENLTPCASSGGGSVAGHLVRIWAPFPRSIRIFGPKDG